MNEQPLPLSDNSEAIQDITEVLQTGVVRDEVDGQKTEFDPDSLRKERRRLEQTDRNARAQRPVASRIHLGGF